MFTEWRKKLFEEISGRQAFRYAERIAQFHRIQASVGYREAANAAVRLLRRDGVEAEIVSYPAQAGERLLAHRSFQEWHCHHAELWLEGEERIRLARFEEEEISLVQRSVATPTEGVHTELVVIENAEDPMSYEGVDLKGKIALVRGNQFLINDLAVEKHGAIGLIFDNLNEYPPIRTRLDMPDAIQYTSFWWLGEERKAFGFAVSPRVGEQLRLRNQKGTVKLSAKVDAELSDGFFENIEFFIPGKKEKEVLLVSHLCHPYPGGQDNASGPGTLMETMRTMNRLIKEGHLPQPDLGIRFLMMPEMTGTYAYFVQYPERRHQTIAALNLDMVGADQKTGGGPLCIEQPPMATPSFVDRFAFQLVKAVVKNTSNFTGTSSYSTVHYQKTRFSGGSDHYIISDPTIGIPCPMFIQWPDKHYHTTEDSISHLDEKLMSHVALTTALYAYGLANGSEAEWKELLTKDIGSRYGELVEQLETTPQSFENRKKTINFLEDYEKKVLNSYYQYAEVRKFDGLKEVISELSPLLDKQIDLLHSYVKVQKLHYSKVKDNLLKPLPLKWNDKVVFRTYDGPFMISHELERLTLDERLKWYHFSKMNHVPIGYDVFIQYWMDGKRTVEDILELTFLETGAYHQEYAIEFLDLSLKLGMVKVVSRDTDSVKRDEKKIQ